MLYLVSSLRTVVSHFGGGIPNLGWYPKFGGGIPNFGWYPKCWGGIPNVGVVSQISWGGIPNGIPNGCETRKHKFGISGSNY